MAKSINQWRKNNGENNIIEAKSKENEMTNQ
jgi:hypothetical protein